MDTFSRSPLYSDDYKPLFSGHETFPLRYGWLKKAHDAVTSAADSAEAFACFNDDSAIGKFGVGKNMVGSMRHWATCCDVIVDAGKGQVRAAAFGDRIFGPNGLDHYLEHPATLWLLHWHLASYPTQSSRPNKTTWQWVFNHYPALAFEKDDLIEGLLKLAEARNWTRVAPATVKNDVECLIRTYEGRQADRDSLEDALSSPLAELGLLRGLRSRYQLVRGPKRSLPLGVFIIALDQFWTRIGTSKSLSFEAIAHAPGSPGRVFLLDEVDLAERLAALDQHSGGLFRWSETAGLKQVLRLRDLTNDDLNGLYRDSYTSQFAREAA